MSTSDEHEVREQLTRYVGGDCTPEEVRALSARVESDPAACDFLAEVLLQAGAVCEVEQTSPELARRVQPEMWWRRAWPWPLAAAVALMVGTIVWMSRVGEEPWVVRTMEVTGSVRWSGQRGKVVDNVAREVALGGGVIETVSDDASVMLAFRDGTLITLMPRSSATISDNGQKRVHLRDGNLTGDVRPQPNGKPMLVHTATAELEVVGTRFDTEAGNTSTRLNVDEGKVRMTRLVDGRAIEVSAEQQAVASLNRTDAMVAVRRVRSVVVWTSDLSQGAKGTSGLWRPPEGTAPARLQAQPQLGEGPDGGRVTIYQISIQIPWERLLTLQLNRDSRVRIRGRMTSPAPLEIMLNTKRMDRGFAGNFFRQIAAGPAAWQLEVPVAEFRERSADGTQAPPEGMLLRSIAIYTINTDAGLEVEQVEVLDESGSSSSSPPATLRPR